MERFQQVRAVQFVYCACAGWPDGRTSSEREVTPEGKNTPLSGGSFHSLSLTPQSFYILVCASEPILSNLSNFLFSASVYHLC